MIEKININGVEYHVTPVAEGATPTGVTVKVDGVVYQLGDPVVATAAEPAATSTEGTIEKISVNGVVYDIADVEAVGAEKNRAQTVEGELAEAIDTEVERAENAEATLDSSINNAKAELKRDAVLSGSVNATSDADSVTLGYRNIDSTEMREVKIPAATTESAGVMSAEDKKKIAELDQYIDAVNSSFYTEEQLSDSYLRLMSTCVKELCIHYKNGYNGDEWVMDSNGIDNDNTLVYTLYNITTGTQIRMEANLSEIKNKLVLLEYADEVYHIYAVINPYLYLNFLKEADGFSSSGWKRIFTEKKDESYILSESVYDSRCYNMILASLNDISNCVSKIEALEKNLQYATPASDYHKNEDFDLSSITQVVSNSGPYFCNRLLSERGFFKSLVVNSESTTSISVIAIRLNKDTLSYEVIKDYGTFHINTGTTTIDIEDADTLLEEGDGIFVKMNNGAFYFKEFANFKNGYQLNGNAIIKSMVVISYNVYLYDVLASDYKGSVPNDFYNVKQSLAGIEQDIDILKDKSISIFPDNKVDSDNYVKLLYMSMAEVSIHYTNGYNGDIWVTDSNGIKNDNTLVFTFLNLTSGKKLTLQKALDEIRNEIVVLNGGDNDCDIYAAINPYLYLNSVPEAGGFNSTSWKRVFTEKKDEKNKLAEIVYSDWAYNMLSSWKYNILEVKEEIESVNDEVNDFKKYIYKCVPSENYFKNEDFDIATLTQSASNETSSYCNTPSRERGFLKSVVVNSVSATNVEIFVARVDSCNLNYTILKEPETFSINQNGTTTIEFDNSVLLEKGDCVFVRFIGGAFNYKFDSTNGGYEFKNGVLTNAAVIVSAYTNITTVEYKPVDVNIPQEIQRVNKNLKSIQEDVNSLQTKVEDLNVAEHEEYIEVFSDDFSTKKDDWILGSSWAWDTNNKEMRPTTVGNINTECVRLNRVYQCDKHIVRFNAKLYPDSVVNICAQRTSNNTGEGESFWQINCAENKLKMFYAGPEFNYWRGVDTARVHTESDITFDVVSGREYAIEVEKNDFTFTLRIFDSITGRSSIVETVGWNAGRLQYYYTFSLGGGTPFAISKFRVFMINNPRVVFVGDSITEGVGMYSTDINAANSMYNRYAELARKKIGKSCISAVGGDVIDTIIKKFNSEYNIIKPKYLSIHIGTNGGITTNTEDKFKEVINLCEAIDCIPIINIISCGASGNYIAINQMLLNLSESEEYKGRFKYCRFDYATSVDNYPWVDSGHLTTMEGRETRVDSSLMTDGTHPNGAGSIKMYNRFSIDVPEIFNA